MSNNSDKDKFFNDYLKGDSEISRLYREAYGEETDMPKDLEEKIKKSIHQMMDEEKKTKPVKPWYVPASNAASIVVVLK